MFSCVLRVLFPLVKTGISPTATTVSGVFATKGKIALCAGGYIYTGDGKIPQNFFEIMGIKRACPRFGEGGQAFVLGIQVYS